MFGDGKIITICQSLNDVLYQTFRRRRPSRQANMTCLVGQFPCDGMFIGNQHRIRRASLLGHLNETL